MRDSDWPPVRVGGWVGASEYGTCAVKGLPRLTVLLVAAILAGCGGASALSRERLLAVDGDLVVMAAGDEDLVAFQAVHLREAGRGDRAPVRISIAPLEAGFVVPEVLVICTEVSVEGYARDGGRLWSRRFDEATRVERCRVANSTVVVWTRDVGRAERTWGVDARGEVLWDLAGRGRLDGGGVVVRDSLEYCWYSVESGERQSCSAYPTFVARAWRVEMREGRILWLIEGGAERALGVQCAGDVVVADEYVVCADESGVVVEWIESGRRWRSDCSTPVQTLVTSSYVVAVDCAGYPPRSFVWRASDGTVVATSPYVLVAAADADGDVVWQVGDEISRPGRREEESRPRLEGEGASHEGDRRSRID